jgi:uncharacterized protein YggE
MKTISTGMLVVLCLAGLSVSMAAGAELSPPHITVSGVGQLSAPPDIVNIQVGVSNEDASAARAMQNTDTAMQNVVDALKRSGVAARDIQTSQYSLQPVHDYNNGKSRLRGYRADNQVSVTLRDLKRVGATLDVLVTAGANQVSGISFGIAKPEALLDRARADAIADARRKADVYAKAAGTTLGAVIAVEEGGASVPRPMVMMRADSVAKDAVIEPGEQQLSVNVTVTWRVK